LNDREYGRTVTDMRAHAAGLVEAEVAPEALGERIGALEADLARRLNEPRTRLGRPTDPEIVRVWGRILEELSQLQLLLARATTAQPGALEALENLLATQPEADRAWALDFARTFDHSLRALVPLFADVPFLRTVIGSRKTRSRFKDAFGNDRLNEVDAWLEQKDPEPKQIATIAAELRTMATYRANKRRKSHARLAIRAATLRQMLFLLLVVVVGTGLVLAWAGHSTAWFVLAAASTGALGSVLSGFFKLRDELHGLTDLRTFRAVLLVQPLVGAAAGLFAFLAVRAGVLSIPDATPGPSLIPYGVYGFIAGFSEPFLIGVVKRLAPEQSDTGSAKES
jgi:hypothetical protein